MAPIPLPERASQPLAVLRGICRLPRGHHRQRRLRSHRFRRRLPALSCTPYRPIWIGLGALAFDLLLVVLATSALRHRIGYSSWRFVHWLAYLCWPIALFHALGSGSDSSLPFVLLVDAVCTAAVLAAVAWRLVTGRTLPSVRRAAAAVGAVVVVLAMAVFAALGPLRPGWSRRSGTSTALLAQLAGRSAGAGGLDRRSVRFSFCRGDSSTLGAVHLQRHRHAIKLGSRFSGNIRVRLTPATAELVLHALDGGPERSPRSGWGYRHVLGHRDLRGLHGVVTSLIGAPSLPRCGHRPAVADPVTPRRPELWSPLGDCDRDEPLACRRWGLMTASPVNVSIDPMASPGRPSQPPPAGVGRLLSAMGDLGRAGQPRRTSPPVGTVPFLEGRELLRRAGPQRAPGPWRCMVSGRNQVAFGSTFRRPQPGGRGQRSRGRAGQWEGPTPASPPPPSRPRRGRGSGRLRGSIADSRARARVCGARGGPGHR